MNRSRLLVLLAVLATAAVALLVLTRGHDAPPPSPAPAAVPAMAAEVVNAGGPADAGAASEGTTKRHEVALPEGTDPTDDPEIVAALAGFTGRVVDARKQAVVDTGVRIYRFAADALFRPGLDLMQESTFEPEYVAGETRTDGAGRFVITGVWPRAVYLMLAGIGSDAPTHRLLQRSPAPGEIVELGDIVLEDAAVVTGIVVDEAGEPVADALVRGADLPGQLIGAVPIERFDPEGCLLIRETGGPPVPVIEFPKWVKRAFDRLPIPTTRSGTDGHFRLTGLVPGSNMIAITKPGLLAKVEPTVMLKPAQVKDLGTLRLKAGEELVGKVLDTAGKPIAGAEVVAGGTTSMMPVDFGVRVGSSDANGEFATTGFPAGNVTVAARRDKGQPWVLAKPQPIAGTVTVTLPAQFALDVLVTEAGGARVDTPQLRLLAGGQDGRDGLLEMAMMGFAPAVDIDGRTRKLEDGRLRIERLDAGHYTLLAQSPHSAVGVQQIELKSDFEVTIALPARIEYAVQVVDPEGKGIRSAAVYVQERGQGRHLDMPLCCGRTDRDGRLTITQAQSESIRVSAEHPRWGSVHGECVVAQAGIVLRMQLPGGIEGVVSEDRQPAPAGKFTVVVEARPETRGSIEDIPQLVANGAEGAFAMRALQPGKYRLQLMKSLDALSSPGGVFAMAQNAMFDDRLPHQEVEVLPGQTAQVVLDASPEVVTGPSGHVYGMITVNGRPGADCSVMSWGQRRAGARCDQSGRFDLGRMPAGQINLNVSMSGGMFGPRGESYSQNFELADGQEKEVLIDIQTSSIAGIVVGSDGSPAAGVDVRANGVQPSTDGKGPPAGSSWAWTRSDQDGAFRFDRLATGVYSLNAEGNGSGRGRAEQIQLGAGQPVTGLRIVLAPVTKVSGRVDLAVLGNNKPQWIWIQFMAQSKTGDPSAPFDRSVDSAGCDKDGAFTTSDLPPGTYHALLIAADDNQPQQRYEHQGDIVVPAQGLDNLILTPVPVASPPRDGRR